MLNDHLSREPGLKRRSYIRNLMICLIVLMLLLPGCSSQLLVPQEIPPVAKIHLPMPSPIKPPDIQFVIMKSGDKTYLGLGWQDYLTLGEFMLDVDEHIKAKTLLLCHYREELAESECSEFDIIKE